MQITNLNPATDIGASSWFVRVDDHCLLLDAGNHPKRSGRDALPLYPLIKNEEVDAIAISHCHHDHVGSLPVAVQHFPKAHVLMTELSYFIVERVLHNSVNVMTRQREELGIKDYPLYTHNEVDDISHLFQGFVYNREIDCASHYRRSGGFTSPTIEFFDAGHALGSAGILVRGSNQSLFYTGDVCFQDQTILKGARFDDVKADVLILETTRGTREVPAGFSRENEINQLAQGIDETLRSKGSVLIPTFALGRTQEILALLALLMKEKKIRRQPVYIGGLGRVFTEIYDLQAQRTHRQLKDMLLHEALELMVLDKNLVDRIQLKSGRLFVLTAGMMSENTAAHDLAARMIEDSKQSIFFVGYADPLTPGGRLKASKPGETFFFSDSVGELTNRCRLQDFDLTAHANRDELVDFVEKVNPKKVILGHGDPEACDWFAATLKKRFPKLIVQCPGPGESVQFE